MSNASPTTEALKVVQTAEHHGVRLRALGLYEAAFMRLHTLVSGLPHPEHVRSGRHNDKLPTAADLRELVKVLESGVVAMNEAADAGEVFQAVDAAQRLGGTTAPLGTR